MVGRNDVETESVGWWSRLNGWAKAGVITGGIVVFMAFLNPFVIVSAGHRGVVLRFSAVSRIMDEGLGVKIPLMERVKKIEIRTVKFQVEAAAASKDIQMVDSMIAVNYHIAPDKVGDLFKEIGMSYESNIIVPSIQEAVKATTAKFNAQELIERREQVSNDTRLLLAEKLMKWGIMIDAFSVMNFKFSEEFEKAVEAKQVAQQNALEQKNLLEKVKYEADQKVASATAEATAIRIQAEAVSKLGGKDYVSLKMIDKWNGELPQITAGGNSGMILNMSDFMKSGKGE